MRIVVKGAMKDFFGTDVIEVIGGVVAGSMSHEPIELFNPTLWAKLETPAERLLGLIRDYQSAQTEVEDITDEGLASYLIEHGVTLNSLTTVNSGFFKGTDGKTYSVNTKVTAVSGDGVSFGLVKEDGTPLQAGDIAAGDTVEVAVPDAVAVRLARLRDEMEKRSLVFDVSMLHSVCGSWAARMCALEASRSRRELNVIIALMQDWDMARRWPLITKWIKEAQEIVALLP